MLIIHYETFFFLKVFLVSTTILFNSILYSQNNEYLNSNFSSNIKNIKSSSVPISFNGYYRFLGFARNQNETFPNNSGKTLSLISGDNFREPMLLLKLKGVTKDRITFGADFMINSLYKGPALTNAKILTLNLVLNIRISFIKTGEFNFIAGGLSWYRQTRLTIW